MIPPAAASVLDIFEDALGVTPATIVSRGTILGRAELHRLMEARVSVPMGSSPRSDLSHQVWPLMSHHTFDGRALFGHNSPDLLPRTLTLLLIHDGLVVADPIEGVHQSLTTRSEAAAVDALNRVVRELAEVEALLAGGLLRLTAQRPTLRESRRAAVLAAMGMSSDMRVFTDLVEAVAFLPEFPGSAELMLAPHVRDLYRRFGLSIRMPTSRSESDRRVRTLAAAVIEVSWQFAVASSDPSCDLAFPGRLEQHLAEALLEQGLEGDLGPSRHLALLTMGRVPNVDVSRLTVADAIAVRREDSFEAFRRDVRLAMDQYQTARAAGVAEISARGAFEEAMRESARSLAVTVRRSTFRDRVKDASIPAALGALAAMPADPMAAAAAAGGVSLATVLWQWLLGRRDERGQAVSQRYLAMLGRVGTAADRTTA